MEVALKEPSQIWLETVSTQCWWDNQIQVYTTTHCLNETMVGK